MHTTFILIWNDDISEKKLSMETFTNVCWSKLPDDIKDMLIYCLVDKRYQLFIPTFGHILALFLIYRTNNLWPELHFHTH